MPQETLTFPPLYCVVGAYRLAHDPSLWQPMWAKCSTAAKHASIVALIWAVCTWPFQRLFVYYFMSASASVTGLGAVYGKIVETADVTDDALPFRIPVPSLQTFATLMFVMGQVHAIMEFWLRRKLRECRNTAYIQTVKSRGKAADWWTEYVEEFSNPPTQKAIKDAKKQAWYLKLASPLVRFFILKVFLLPVDFVPFFGMALGAALRSLTYGRLLHKTFFEAKRMSPFQIELWITERQSAYRSFGFVAALMERIPLIGLVFSISNRIGAAMWAHDLEKRQQRVRASLSASSESGAGVVELEEFKSKPTLKKIYKTVQQESAASSSPAATGNDTSSGSSDGAQEASTFNGEGLAVLRRHQNGQSANGLFTHLSFTFPLKLICPGVSSRNATRDPLVRHAPAAASSQTAVTASNGSSQKESVVASTSARDGSGSGGKAVNALYIVGYGGGLVSGDSVDLDVDVGSECCLLILTQGSTKVFKTRTSRPTLGVSTATFSSPFPTAPSASFTGNEERGKGQSMTRQNFRFLIRPHSTLVLLPDPVTCFAAARYDQVQRFDLRSRASSSCVVLDWITPGRTAVPPAFKGNQKLDHLDSHSASQSRSGGPAKDYSVGARDPELWAFSHYRSRNDVRIAGSVVARDTVLLSQHLDEQYVDPVTGWSFSELARRNHPYGCYATLILAGPDAADIVDALQKEFEAIQQRPTTAIAQDEVLWSLSKVEEGEADGAVVVRLAAKDAQTVRRWLYARLTALQSVVGKDLYRQALG
ncbi:hypothetical protein EX895_001589 [Sporisorium graminicola]|uniref:Urease accessory protein UreD n=1 Tax=Sporisorium graminicola TaxID=280036 RepID=A0A4U7KZZ0_9BASI|nr:hypothetical protein EX895_001589 [Sporisorium graminicola]TKY89058.1 hypothetical protein EX895_001589 [Sporisorium graminicola]